MEAIALLEQQHDDIEALFGELERAYTPEEIAERFERLSDALAIHFTLEEQVFYPAIELADCDELLLEPLATPGRSASPARRRAGSAPASSSTLPRADGR